jgi:hypothetical protein
MSRFSERAPALALSLLIALAQLPCGPNAGPLAPAMSGTHGGACCCGSAGMAAPTADANRCPCLASSRATGPAAATLVAPRVNLPVSSPAPAAASIAGVTGAVAAPPAVSLLPADPPVSPAGGARAPPPGA